ncbi:MAG: ShlB/FhaC/HecB family hemolysin secretion/activation protein [Parachlamydiales bacterium]|nr:ShlB/FhaC/HecB family hemolysin secretion/activation protein [Parachlamydiales bacterium]
MRKKNIILLVMILGQGFLFGGERSSSIVIPEGRALVLYPSLESMRRCNFISEQGVVLEGLDIPGDLNEFKRNLEPYFLRRPVTKKDILAMKQKIQAYYKEHNRPVVMVLVPRQKITQGILRLVVIESRLDTIHVEGNRWFSSEEIKNWISIRQGEYIDQSTLVRNLTIMNRNPFRDVNAIYAPGSTQYSTDITLHVTERRPIRVYAGTENTGLPLIGKKRWLAGLQCGKIFGRADLFTYQYIAAFDLDKFYAHMAHYTVHLPWQHVLELYGGYSKNHGHVPFVTTGVPVGESIQGSMRYHIPLSPSFYSLHDFVFGADYKRTNSNVEYSLFSPSYGDNVNIFQVMMGASALSRFSSIKSSLDAELYWSPGRWLKDQKSSDFNTLRSLAKNYYAYGLMKGSMLWMMPHDFSMSALIKGQLSSGNLLPSEQFGIGGHDTVRGYEERTANGEHGILGSLEFRSPPCPLFFHQKKLQEHWQLLAFVDAGWAFLDRKGALQMSKSEHLIGCGPGLRYVIDPYISLRADFGFKLRKKDFEGGSMMIHFSLVGSF